VLFLRELREKQQLSDVTFLLMMPLISKLHLTDSASDFE
jgi:hypothetical protein